MREARAVKADAAPAVVVAFLFVCKLLPFGLLKFFFFVFPNVRVSVPCKQLFYASRIMHGGPLVYPCLNPVSCKNRLRMDKTFGDILLAF